MLSAMTEVRGVEQGLARTAEARRRRRALGQHPALRPPDEPGAAVERQCIAHPLAVAEIPALCINDVGGGWT